MNIKGAKLRSVLRKFAYVIVREDPLGPIIQSQVIDVLEILSERSDTQVMLLWFYRVDYLFTGSIKIKALRNALGKRGINLIAVPFVAGRFPVSWWVMPFVLPQWLIGLAWVRAYRGVTIFHCRSYHAALACACLGVLLRIRFIFDPRSPFPEENLFAKRWRRGSGNFLFWKKMEVWLCRVAVRTLAVSNPFAESLAKGVYREKIVVIPNNYPAIFDTNRAILPADAVSSRGSEITLGYVGSLGHWNDADLYIEFLERFIQYANYPVSILFIIPTRSRSVLEESLSKSRSIKDIAKIVTLAQKDVYWALSSCTVGLQLMRRVDERVGIKCVEYLAAGLPVIASENIRGAADIIQRHNVGFLVDPTMSNVMGAVNFAKSVSHHRNAWKILCLQLAQTEFSTGTIADKVAAVYVAAEAELSETAAISTNVQ